VLDHRFKCVVHLKYSSLALTREQISLRYIHALAFLVPVIFRASIMNVRFHMKKSSGVTKLATDSFLISTVTGTGI